MKFEVEIKESKFLHVENLANGKFRVGITGEAFWIQFDSKNSRCTGSCPTAWCG